MSYVKKVVLSGQTRNNKAYKGESQTDKQAIVATEHEHEHANITEAVVKVVAEAARVVVQAIAMSSSDNNQMGTECGTQTRQNHQDTTNI